LEKLHLAIVVGERGAATGAATASTECCHQISPSRRCIRSCEAGEGAHLSRALERIVHHAADLARLGWRLIWRATHGQRQLRNDMTTTGARLCIAAVRHHSTGG
jgi:hypothetical protein